MYDSLAVVGATGAVGRIILRLLEERNLPFERIKFLASGRSRAINGAAVPVYSPA